LDSANFIVAIGTGATDEGITHRSVVPSFCVGLLIAGYIGGVAHAQDVPQKGRDGQRLQRLLQYEALLGIEMTADVALCMDAALNSQWLLPSKATQEVQPLIIDRVRHAGEACEVSKRPEDRRLAEQMRARVEQQLEGAAWAQERLPKARACLAQSADLVALRNCVSTTLGVQPSEADWRRWSALFERRKR